MGAKMISKKKFTSPYPTALHDSYQSGQKCTDNTTPLGGDSGNGMNLNGLQTAAATSYIQLLC